MGYFRVSGSNSKVCHTCRHLIQIHPKDYEEIFYYIPSGIYFKKFSKNPALLALKYDWWLIFIVLMQTLLLRVPVDWWLFHFLSFALETLPYEYFNLLASLNAPLSRYRVYVRAPFKHYLSSIEVQRYPALQRHEVITVKPIKFWATYEPIFGIKFISHTCLHLDNYKVS